MNYDEQTDAFSADLGNLVLRYLKEFDLNIQTVVGVLEEKKHDLLDTGIVFIEGMDLDDDELNEGEQE